MGNNVESHKSGKIRMAIFVMLCGGALGFAAPIFLNIVVSLGHNIPQQDLMTDYVVAVYWAIALGASILVWPVSYRDRAGLLFIWFVKILVTLGFMLIYENHYLLDCYDYFKIPLMDGFAFIWPSFSGRTNVENIVWLHHQVMPDSYHMLKVSFSMVGLVGVYIFYRAAVVFLRREDIRIFYALALFPSILFWSSIIGKDPLIILGVAVYVYGAISWHKLKRGRYFILMAIGILAASMIRIWMAPILLAPAMVLAMSGRQGIISKAVVIVLIVATLIAVGPILQNRFAIEAVQDLVETTDKMSQNFSEGGSALAAVRFTSINSMVYFAPVGMFTALFRPLPGEVMNLFGILAGLENLCLLFLLLIAVKRTSLKELKDPVVLWAIILILVWSAMYGFVSFNLGAVARFKVQILPIFLALMLYLARKRSKLRTP